jgi:hypothetical protein
MPGEAPRQHHLISAFYLAGFTASGRTDGAIEVFDYFTAKQYRSSPKNVCKERDFFKIEEPGVDPYLFEKIMAEFEKKIAPTVQTVAKEGRSATRSRWATSCRSPLYSPCATAEAGFSFRWRLQRAFAEALASGTIDPEKWEQIRESEIRFGTAPADLPSYLDAIHAARNGWIPPAPKILVVGMIPEMQEAVMKQLTRPAWELMTTDSNLNGGFICSDSPLVWGALDRITSGDAEQSLMDADVEITFPVTRNVALVSYPGARNGNLTAVDEIVGHINMRTLQLSTGLIFHTDGDFLLKRLSGDLKHGSEYLAYLREARARGVAQP